MTAWEAVKSGHTVDLLERGRVMSATSSASTKLLHGGLRYLENGHLLMVRESLLERGWWLKAAPHLTHIVKLILPIYRDSLRPRWKIKIGMMIYDRLAGRLGIGNHLWLSCEDIVRLIPSLKTAGLQGGYLFFDGQMDDYALGKWAVDQAESLGVKVHEYTRVDGITANGTMKVHGKTKKYDWIVNVSGPWVVEVLERSNLPHECNLDLLRGSHLILDRTIGCGVMLEDKEKGRFVFALPYKEGTLLGTTEVRQNLNEPIECSKSETDYLIKSYNTYFEDTVSDENVTTSFSGVRPLIYSHDDPNKASREYKIERYGRIISVFGGKWTTSRAMAKRVVSKIPSGN